MTKYVGYDPCEHCLICHWYSKGLVKFMQLQLSKMPLWSQHWNFAHRNFQYLCNGGRTVIIRITGRGHSCVRKTQTSFKKCKNSNLSFLWWGQSPDEKWWTDCKIGFLTFLNKCCRSASLHQQLHFYNSLLRVHGNVQLFHLLSQHKLGVWMCLFLMSL